MAQLVKSRLQGRRSELIPESGRKWHPLQSSCLENPKDREAWWASVHRVTRVRHGLVTKLPPTIKWEKIRKK